MLKLPLLLLILLACAFQVQAATFEVPPEEYERGPVPPQEAFVFTYTYDGIDTYVFSWKISRYYYMYKDKFSFETAIPIAIDTTYSSGDTAYEDPYFGDIRIYKEDARVTMQIREKLSEPVDMIVGYQGCWEGGVCYAPQQVTLSLSSSPIDKGLSGAAQAGKLNNQTQASNSLAPKQILSQAATAGINAQQTDEPGIDFVNLITNNSDQNLFLDVISQGNILWLILIFFVAGIALAFTPCVFPTIPLVSGIITRSSDSITPLRGFMMTLTFVLSASFTYSLIGLVVSSLGHNLQVLLQQPWIIITSAGIFVVLAFAMFGMFSVQVPLALQQKLNAIANRQNNASFYGLAVMGILSTLIIGPCLTAPLAGILVYLADQGNPVQGGLSLFALGMGMGTPLLLAGTMFGSWLPKAGAWLVHIQRIFGFIMLLMAVWMLDRIVPELSLLLYGIVLIFFGIYLWHIQKPENRSGASSFMKGVSFIVLLFGILQVVGYTTGSTSVYQPLKDSFLGSSEVTNNAAKTDDIIITSSRQLNDQVLLATKIGKPVMIKFRADWCVACEQIERDVFSDAAVISEMASIYLVVADVTEINDYTLDLLAQYKIPGPPALLFFDSGGQYREDLLLLGNITSGQVLDRLSKVNS